MDKSKRRRRVILGLVFIAGATTIFLSWLFRSSGFGSSLALEIGAGLLLFGFLFWIETQIEQRIESVRAESEKSVEEVRQEVAGVAETVAEVEKSVASLANIGEATKAAVQERRDQIDAAFDAFENAVTVETVSNLLAEAERVKAIDSDGVRVALGGWTRHRLRFKRLGVTADGDVIVELRIETVDGTVVSGWVWAADASEVMLRVVEELQKIGEYSDEFDATPILVTFRDTLRRAIDAKTGLSGPRDLGPVVEVPHSQWAITTWGLEGLEYHYPIGKDDFEENWTRHMSEKSWVDMDDFHDSFVIGKAIFDREAAEAREGEWGEAPF